MRKLFIEKAEAGMVLAKPLTNSEGKVLLAEGAALSERIISRLAEWGCETLYVEGDPQTTEEKGQALGFDLEENDIEEIFADIDKRFRRVEADEYMAMIKRGLKTQILSKFQKIQESHVTEERDQESGNQN